MEHSQLSSSSSCSTLILECEIPGRCRSLKNNKRIIFRRGKRLIIPIISQKKGRLLIIPSKKYEEWKEIALQYLQIAKGKSKYGFPLPFPIHVQALAYYDRQPFDLYNILNSVAEVLQEANVILNDNAILSYDGSRRFTCGRGASKIIVRVFKFMEKING